MTDATRELDPGNAGNGSVVIVEAIVETRRVVIASLMMWATGYVVKVLKDLPQPSVPAEALTRSIWSVVLHLVLVIFLISIAFWAPRAARSLGLPRASSYWGAWVPCMNPIAVFALSWRLLQVMGSFGVSKSLLFATRRRLESEL